MSRLKAVVFFGGVTVILAVAAFLRFLPPHRETRLVLGTTPITAEVVATPDARARGLSGRMSLAPDRGMLFVFPVPSPYSFWMVDMHFPIDILWLKEGIIVDMALNVQPPVPGTSEDALPRYIPRLPADTVLEVAGGVAAASGLKIGDIVHGG